MQDEEGITNTRDIPAIAMIGNLSEGYTPYGPFDCFDDAAEFADKNFNEVFSYIMELHVPHTQGEKHENINVE